MVLAAKILKKVKFDLTSVDSNAFMLMGVFQRKARDAGWPQSDVDAVLMECRKGNYDHLVQTLMQYCE